MMVRYLLKLITMEVLFDFHFIQNTEQNGPKFDSVNNKDRLII